MSPSTSCWTSTKARRSSSECKTELPHNCLFLIGSPYLSEWDFFTQGDPTHGNVIYESRETSKDLAYVQDDGTAVMKVDNSSSVPPGGNRRS